MNKTIETVSSCHSAPTFKKTYGDEYYHFCTECGAECELIEFPVDEIDVVLGVGSEMEMNQE
jgi:hypothetical protein